MRRSVCAVLLGTARVGIGTGLALADPIGVNLLDNRGFGAELGSAQADSFSSNHTWTFREDSLALVCLGRVGVATRRRKRRIGVRKRRTRV